MVEFNFQIFLKILVIDTVFSNCFNFIQSNERSEEDSYIGLADQNVSIKNCSRSSKSFKAI